MASCRFPFGSVEQLKARYSPRGRVIRPRTNDSTSYETRDHASLFVYASISSCLPPPKLAIPFARGLSAGEGVSTRRSETFANIYDHKPGKAMDSGKTDRQPHHVWLGKGHRHKTL